MTKRGTGGSQSSSPKAPSRTVPRETMTSNANRRLKSSLFAAERVYTIILTSLVWLVVLFITIQYQSSKNCLQTNLIKSKVA